MGTPGKGVLGSVHPGKGALKPNGKMALFTPSGMACDCCGPVGCSCGFLPNWNGLPLFIQPFLDDFSYLRQEWLTVGSVTSTGAYLQLGPLEFFVGSSQKSSAKIAIGNVVPGDQWETITIKTQYSGPLYNTPAYGALNIVRVENGNNNLLIAELQFNQLRGTQLGNATVYYPRVKTRLGQATRYFAGQGNALEQGDVFEFVISRTTRTITANLRRNGLVEAQLVFDDSDALLKVDPLWCLCNIKITHLLEVNSTTFDDAITWWNYLEVT